MMTGQGLDRLKAIEKQIGREIKMLSWPDPVHGTPHVEYDRLCISKNNH